MKLSRTSILLLCTAVVTFTSIGMSTFSLFLPPIEKEFGLSRALATLPYMIAMIGWAAGAVLFGGICRNGLVAQSLANITFLRRFGRYGDGRVQPGHHVSARVEAFRGA